MDVVACTMLPSVKEALAAKSVQATNVVTLPL